MSHRRLRCEPVGKVRRRWASILAERKTERSAAEAESGGEECSELDEGEWFLSDGTHCQSADPLYGSRPKGLKYRLWESDEDPKTPQAESPASPSTTSLGHRAFEAGMSKQEIEETSRLLGLPEVRDKLIAIQSPTSMDRATAKARKIVSTLFQSRKTPSGAWQGPLPQPSLTSAEIRWLHRGWSSPVAGDCQQVWFSFEFKFKIGSATQGDSMNGPVKVAKTDICQVWRRLVSGPIRALAKIWPGEENWPLNTDPKPSKT